MVNCDGKTALVTGASRGIGRASALALAAAGARVLVHYGRGTDEANAVVDEIRKAGGRAEAVSADLAATDGPHKLAADCPEPIAEPQVISSMMRDGEGPGGTPSLPGATHGELNSLKMESSGMAINRYGKHLAEAFVEARTCFVA